MKLVIIGAGGFGREVLDVADAMGDLHGMDEGSEPLQVIGFIDDGEVPADRLDRLGVPHLGGTSKLGEVGATHYVVGVGSPDVRARLTAMAEDAGLVAATLIHPSVTIGRDVKIGAGSVLCAGVRLTTNIRIGEHVHLNLNVTIGHDTALEDYVTVNPLAAISGDVILGYGSMIGTTACVNQGLTVGAGAVVGSGAAVIRNVEPGAVVAGVPAKPLGQR